MSVHQCPKCFAFLRDYLESCNRSKFFEPYLTDYTQFYLDFTRCISKGSIYGAKARANLYMKPNNALYYSFLLKVIRGTTAHTRFLKEYAYFRQWLLERNFYKSDNRLDPFQSIDIFLETNFIRILDSLYEAHDAHSNPQSILPTYAIEIVEDDDWAEYDAISPK